MIDNSVISMIREAVESGDANDFRNALKSHPEYLNHKTGAGTWLHKAVSSGDLDKVKSALDLGIDINAEWHIAGHVTLPLSTAITRDNPAIARLLLERGANPNHDRQVIGAVQANKNALELVKLLDEHGADLHQEFPWGPDGDVIINALSTAIDWGKDDVAEYLRSRGCVLPGQPPTAPMQPQTLADEVVEFFTNHFGSVRKQSLVEIVPTEPAIAVHVVPPTKDRDRVTLFTTGMSSEPMNVGDKWDKSFALAELFIELPDDWTYQRIEDPNHGWPVHWLRWMAKTPHQQHTALGPATVVSQDSPPAPIAPGASFDAMLLLAEREFRTDSGRTVRLYRMTPLYPEERELERREGLPALMRAFDSRNISFAVDLRRTNVATV